MYETLTTFDDDYAIKPQTADWEVSGDGTDYTFTIREGLLFHDGSPVESEDVRQCLDRYIQTTGPTTTVGIMWGELDNIETINNKSFRISFKRPVPAIVNAFGAMAGRVPIMMPKELCETDPNESVETYIGSGPYQLKEWVRGDRVELERFEGYVARTEPTSGFAGKRHAYADEIHILEIPDPTTRLAGLQAGQFDYVAELSLDFYNTVKDDPNINVIINEPGVRPFIWFNNINPPTDNVMIRRALVASWNHEDALIAAAGGLEEFYTVCGVITWCVDSPEIRHSQLTRGLEHYNPNDKTRALEMAEQAGYDGELIIINASQDVPTLFNVSQVFFENMKDAGFNVELASRDHAANEVKIQEETGWNIAVVTNSWANAIPLRFRTAMTFTFASRFQASDRMLEVAREMVFATDNNQLIELLNEHQELSYLEAGCCHFVGQVKTMTATRSNLKGFTPHSVMFLVNSWLEQ